MKAIIKCKNHCQIYRYTLHYTYVFSWEIKYIQVGSKGNYLIIIIYVFYIDDNILLIQS